MTPDDLRAMQETLGLDAAGAAEFFFIGPRTYRRCLSGDQDIPLWIVAYGKLLVEIANGQMGEPLAVRLVRDRGAAE